MFSFEFGRKKISEEMAQSRKIDVHTFLKEQYVVCQSYRINEQLEYINMPLVLWSMSDVSNILQPHSGTHTKLEEAIQYVGHIKNTATNKITFVAIDPFSSYHFDLDPQLETYSDYRRFYGNNELQMQRLADLSNPDIDSHQKHDIESPFYMSPFLKHQNPQFLIQKEKVTLNIIDKNKVIDQYYYMTNDNQFMLIYPNYENTAQKNQVIFQIAQKHQYNQNPDVDYEYQDDFDQRQRDYWKAEYKKISHVCHDDYRSKNHMKRAEHLRMILDYPRPLNCLDKLILSTDQERSNIYIYQSHVVTGENLIDIYNYENNIAYSSKARSLPQQIAEINKEEELLFAPRPTSRKW